jgi:hypothetical protein
MHQEERLAKMGRLMDQVGGCAAGPAAAKGWGHRQAVLAQLAPLAGRAQRPGAPPRWLQHAAHECAEAGARPPPRRSAQPPRRHRLLLAPLPCLPPATIRCPAAPPQILANIKAATGVADLNIEAYKHCFIRQLNPGLFPGRPKVSFLLQYFKRPKSVHRILDPLYKCSQELPMELVVNIDHPQDAELWVRGLGGLATWGSRRCSPEASPGRGKNRARCPPARRRRSTPPMPPTALWCPCSRPTCTRYARTTAWPSWRAGTS